MMSSKHEDQTEKTRERTIQNTERAKVYYNTYIHTTNASSYESIRREKKHFCGVVFGKEFTHLLVAIKYDVWARSLLARINKTCKNIPNEISPLKPASIPHSSVRIKH